MFNEDGRMVIIGFKDGTEIRFEQEGEKNQYYIWMSHKDYEYEDCIGTFEVYNEDKEITVEDFNNIAVVCYMKCKKIYLEEALNHETSRQLEF